MVRGFVLRAAVGLAVLMTVPGAAAQAAEAPCPIALEKSPVPELGAPPIINLLVGANAEALGACPNWRDSPPDLAVALVGSIPHDGSSEGILERFGAISGFAGTRYWSTSEKQWRPFITTAHALAGPGSSAARDDFAGNEMPVGAELYFLQEDSRSTSPVTYRLTVLTRDEDHVAVEIRNVSSVRFHLLTLFSAGDLRSLYFVDRTGPGVWSYRSISSTRVGWAGSVAGRNPESSLVNRTVALFRRFAGIPTDLEPPAAR